MLTNRQIDILSYLYSKKKWVTSEELSLNLGLNKKTIQLEIKIIFETFNNSCIILASNNRGYFLEYLSNEVKNLVYKEIINHGGKYTLKLKPSLFVFYLLFLKSYVTMQALADFFYMSKSGVSLELETVKRWLKRYEGMDLEISNKNGIKIQAEEKRKRFYCSKFGLVSIFREMPFQKEIATEFEEYLEIVEKILAKVLIKNNYFLTGEEYSKLCRFISISILRSRMGYTRNSNDFIFNTNNLLIIDLIHCIKIELNYGFEKEELYDLEEILFESDTLITKRNMSQDVINKLSNLEKEIIAFLKINNKSISLKTEEVIEFIENMLLREKNKHRSINYYNENIIAKYPLETYLIDRFFSSCFQVKIKKELSFLSLFLASGLSNYKEKLSILLVSNQNVSIISHIKNLLYKNNNCNILEIKVIPEYLFNSNLEKKDFFDIFLTTEQEVLFLDEKFYFIEATPSFEEIKNLNFLFLEEMHKKNRNKIARIKNVCMSEQIINKKPLENDTINYIIGYPNETTYFLHTFGNEKMFINNIDENVETKIVIYTLVFPFQFNDKKIRKVIFAQFDKNRNDIFDFFSAVSEILVSNL